MLKIAKILLPVNVTIAFVVNLIQIRYESSLFRFEIWLIQSTFAYNNMIKISSGILIVVDLEHFSLTFRIVRDNFCSQFDHFKSFLIKRQNQYKNHISS